MEKPQDQLYYKGYLAGYRDGVKNALDSKARETSGHEIADLPIKMMGLSSRAVNCLTRAGCTYVADVVALSDYTIATMRNMGAKTASEVAHWLDTQGICCSAWCKYL